jgi:hypothetical protein
MVEPSTLKDPLPLIASWRGIGGLAEGCDAGRSTLSKVHVMYIHSMSTQVKVKVPSQSTHLHPEVVETLEM